MAKLAARGSGPIGFTDDAGSQHFIPLGWVVFDNGAIKLEAPANALPAGLDAPLNKWLTVLAAEGILESEPPPPPQVGPPPAPVPGAMVIRSKVTGPLGNDVTVKVLNVRTRPSDGKKVFDMVVTETEEVSDLKAADVKTNLGSSAGAGLVFVSSAGAAGTPKNGDYAFVPGATPATDPAKSDIADTTTPTPGVAFTLSTRGVGDDAKLTKTTVSADAAHAGSFVLKTTWSKSADGLEPGDVAGAFDYAITVAQAPAPAGGGPQPPLGVPAEGEYTLSGGADTAPAASASAQLPSA